MLKKAIVMTTLGVIALAVNGLGQGEKKGGSSRSYAILQPQMTAEKGSYDAPMGKLGEAPAQPWSATTIGAAVDGKPNTGAVKTVVGEIVDFSCYLQVGKHGERHRPCDQKLCTNVQLSGLLTKDGKLDMLMEEEKEK